jgi:aryl-alcohol dehydrogenase-like predicted oxidoreductase
VSSISFGAGPVPALLTSDVSPDKRLDILRHALTVGINWFDTAATYGNGASEENLGACLHELGATKRVHLATKVRFLPEDLSDVRGHILRSVEGSLKRLRTDRLALLQLHNSVTKQRGDLATSVTVRDVCAAGGILEGMRELQAAGVVQQIGLTGLGHAEELVTLVNTGAFDTIQIPFNVLNPSAGYPLGPEFPEMSFGNVLKDCAAQNMGVFAIRVYAGGALVGQPPSAHTLTTKFFPLELYKKDGDRSRSLCDLLASDIPMSEIAVRFVLGHPAVSSAIIGFSELAEIDAAVRSASKGCLPESMVSQILRATTTFPNTEPDDAGR